MRCLPSYVTEPAWFPDPQHRIWLRRRLSGSGAPVGFILHNPSTAGQHAHGASNDPTATRCIGYANALDASDLVMVNAATGIGTDAAEMWKVRDPFAGSLEAIRAAAEFCRDGVLIAAWGPPKGCNAKQRSLMITQYGNIARLGLPLHVLKFTAEGYPSHPLYLSKALRPVPWNGRDAITLQKWEPSCCGM